MSLTKLSLDLPLQAIFEPFKQAQYLSQIIPAYRKGMINADEIYSLATYSSPVAACPLFYVVSRGNYRIVRFI